MYQKSVNLLQFRHLKRVAYSKVINYTCQQDVNNQNISCIKSSRYLNDVECKKYFLENNPDTFGILNIAAKDLIVNNYVNEDDLHEETFLENPSLNSTKLSIKEYADLIKDCVRKRKIKEAIDVLEVKMIVEDRVKPDNYIYNLILGACGRVGYTKKAFSLFNDMKKRGLRPTAGTYTALFNSCANSPWPEDGLSRAKRLRELMADQTVALNDTIYNAMIKTFGRCGDIHTAFALVDEMFQTNVPLKEETINFLLQSCASNKQAGFRHAVLLWRKFHEKSIKPSIFSYNLMLRCVRDCSFDYTDTTQYVLKSPEFQLVESTTNELTECQSRSNLMAPTPNLGNLSVIKLSAVTKTEDRLLLLGGCSGFLRNMQASGINPDIKTFTLLLDNVPSTLTAEKELLNELKQCQVKPDVNFLNMLIKKRSMRFDYENAKAVLDMFKWLKLRPDVLTYGVLALGCRAKEEAKALLDDMRVKGYRPNIEILGTMLKQACVSLNYVYVLYIMELTIKEDIRPNRMFIQHLEDLYKRSKTLSKQQKNPFFTKGFQLFRMRYEAWRKEVELDSKEDAHPWAQYRTATQTNVKHYKDTDTRFKPRVTSRYKQKTGRRTT